MLTLPNLITLARILLIPVFVGLFYLQPNYLDGEPLGWIIENIGPDMLVYASDYPHPEGTSDPIGKFEATMTNCDEATMNAFYHGNMEELMGIKV